MTSRGTVWLILAALWPASASLLRAADPLPPLFILDEKPTSAAWTAAEETGKLTFQLAEGKSAVYPAEKLVCWGQWKPPGRGAIVVLARGGWLVGELLSIDKENVRLDSDLFGELQLPLGLVAGLIPRPPSEARARDAWLRRLLAAEGSQDRLWLENGDELSGKILRWDGLKTLALRVGSDEQKLALSNVVAVLFNPALADAPAANGPFTWIGFSDGSRVRAAKLNAAKADCKIELLGGVPLACRREGITALQPLGGKAIYLSDLKPDSYKQVPYLDLTWPYERDWNVLGGGLQSGGRTYLKGLGTHSASRLTYTLPAGVRRFESEVGIDDVTQGKGSVLFRVFADDGSGTWKSLYDSPVVRGGGAPLPVSVDLTGVKRISLLVEFADRGDEQDHADWLNPRFVK